MYLGIHLIVTCCLKEEICGSILPSDIPALIKVHVNIKDDQSRHIVGS